MYINSSSSCSSLSQPQIPQMLQLSLALNLVMQVLLSLKLLVWWKPFEMFVKTMEEVRSGTRF